MSNAPSQKTAGRAAQPGALPGQDDSSSQQHRETQDPKCLTASDHQHHKSSIQPIRELHASLPNRPRNPTVDEPPSSNEDFLYQVPLPHRSLQAQASPVPTPVSPGSGTLSADTGPTSRLDKVANSAERDKVRLLYFAPPIPGVNGNEVIYQTSTKKAKKHKYLFKKKDPSRDYSNHSSAHLVSPYQILAEIYSVEGKEIGLREFSHELKDGNMCTLVMDIYASHKTPASGMPKSFSNIYPKLRPIESPTITDVSRYRHPRIRASKAAAAAITTSVPELGSIDPPSFAPAGRKLPLNPLSTTLKWSSSKRKFDVFTSETDTPALRPSP